MHELNADDVPTAWTTVVAWMGLGTAILCLIIIVAAVVVHWLDGSSL